MKQKVFFVQEISKDKFETESFWCIKLGEYFVVANIPFIAKRISLGDTIKAEYDEDDKVYYFDDFISVSNNTTLRLYINSESIIADTRKMLSSFGCESEAFLQRKIVAVNVPKNVNYKPIKSYLDYGENEVLWIYEESCLCHTY